VAWPIACRPKELGGLGLIDLRRFGVALQLHWEWQCRLQSNQPWVPLPLAESKTILSAFQAATNVVLGDGRTVVFWLDRWMPDGRSVLEVAPNILAKVGCRQRSRTVVEAVESPSLVLDN